MTTDLVIRRCEALVAACDGKFEEANQIFQDVIDACERIGARLQRAQVLREWGALLSESDRPEDKTRAREMLEEALAGYKAMGSTLNAQWIKDKLNLLEAAL